MRAQAPDHRRRRHQEVPVADLGWPELTIIALAVVLLFGWKRMPDMARSLGRSARIFKSEVDQMRTSSDSDPPVAPVARVSGGVRDDAVTAEERASAAEAEVARLRAELETRRPTSGSH